MCSEANQPLSIHDLLPLEIGGVKARQGFQIQDHVAAGFCIQMLSNPHLLQVWCETQDDITLISKGDGGEQVEFVQVKSSELNQLWSISELCKREKGKSIIERSLEYDRCIEPCFFRIVTCGSVMRELKVLQHHIGSEERILKNNELNTLKSELENKVGDYKSSNGHGSSYWADRAQWEVIHSEDSIKNQNLLALSKIIEEHGEYLANDQLEELYTKILAKVKDAALANTHSQKKIPKKIFSEWLEEAIYSALHPASAGCGKTLRIKLENACIPDDSIKTALEQRRRYRTESLSPKYLDIGTQKNIESEIQARLNHLLAKLDAGEIDDNGLQFHLHCLDDLKKFKEETPKDKQPPLAFLQGFMYSLADRCLHRFRRISA
jgi:hypothetical protein